MQLRISLALKINLTLNVSFSVHRKIESVHKGIGLHAQFAVSPSVTPKAFTLSKKKKIEICLYVCLLTVTEFF